MAKVTHEIREAFTDDEIKACFPVVQELRPHITDPEELLRKVKLQHGENYHLMYIKDKITEDGEPVVVSIMGYRITNCLFYGKQLYIDDLCTLSTGGKRRGYGGALLDWGIAKAKAEQCNVATLDSGYARRDAHRLYMNKRFYTHCHHFCNDLKD